MRIATAVLAVSIIAAPALAQTTTPPAANRDSTSTSNPAVAAPSDTAKGAAPAEGANSFTEGQARSRLERDGYTIVGSLLKDAQGVWRGQASKAGQTVNVAVDYKGDIVAR